MASEFWGFTVELQISEVEWLVQRGVTVVGHNFNTSTQETEVDFEASLVYTEISRPTRATR